MTHEIKLISPVPGKSLRHLVDGNTRIESWSFWRQDFSVVADMKEGTLSGFGVYVLWDALAQKVYIGRADNLIKRVQTHCTSVEKNWWSEVAFATVDATSVISKEQWEWLELALIKSAVMSEGWSCANSQQACPVDKKLSPAQLASCKNHLDQISSQWYMLGCSALIGNMPQSGLGFKNVVATKDHSVQVKSGKMSHLYQVGENFKEDVRQDSKVSLAATIDPTVATPKEQKESGLALNKENKYWLLHEGEKPLPCLTLKESYRREDLVVPFRVSSEAAFKRGIFCPRNSGWIAAFVTASGSQYEDVCDLESGRIVLSMETSNQSSKSFRESVQEDEKVWPQALKKAVLVFYRREERQPFIYEGIWRVSGEMPRAIDDIKRTLPDRFSLARLDSGSVSQKNVSL